MQRASTSGALLATSKCNPPWGDGCETKSTVRRLNYLIERASSLILLYDLFILFDASNKSHSLLSSMRKKNPRPSMPLNCLVFLAGNR